MVTVAIVLAAVSLALSLLVALAVIELVLDRAPGSASTGEDHLEDLVVAPEVVESRASAHGLPEWIDTEDAHIVLIVSPLCAVCARIVQSFEGTVPEDVTVLVTAGAPDRKRDWAARSGLPVEDLVFDDGMSIVNSLRITSSPTAVGFGNGRVSFAAGLGGRAALDSLLEQRDIIGGDKT